MKTISFKMFNAIGFIFIAITLLFLFSIVFSSCQKGVIPFDSSAKNLTYNNQILLEKKHNIFDENRYLGGNIFFAWLQKVSNNNQFGNENSFMHFKNYIINR